MYGAPSTSTKSDRVDEGCLEDLICALAVTLISMSKPKPRRASRKAVASFIAGPANLPIGEDFGNCLIPSSCIEAPDCPPQAAQKS